MSVSNLKSIYKKSRELLQQTYKQMNKLLTRDVVLFILVALIINQIIIILFATLQSDPHILFDESNTLRISQLPFSGILEVLSYEQNFPLYYLIAHVFLAIFKNYIALSIFNFAIWVFSFFVLYRLLKLFFSHHWSLYFLLLYSFVTSINYYAYSLRMYGLINLVLLAYFYWLFLYARKNQLLLLIYANIAVLVLVLLHPTMLVVLVLSAIVEVILIRKRLHYLIFLVCKIITSAILLLEVSMKEDILRIYVTQGMEYMGGFEKTFWEFPSQLLFRGNYQFFDILFYLVCGYCVFLFIKNINMKAKENSIPSIFLILLLIVHLFVRKYAPYHYIYLTGPFLLAIFQGVFNENKKRRKFLAITLLILFFLQHKVFYNEDNLCNSISNLNKETIIVGYDLYNQVDYCNGGGNKKVVLFDRSGFIDISGLSVKQILIIQAKKGGITTPEFPELFQEKLKALNSKQREKLENEFEVLFKEEHIAYVVKARDFLYEQELSYFTQQYTLKTVY